MNNSICYTSIKYISISIITILSIYSCTATRFADKNYEKLIFNLGRKIDQPLARKFTYIYCTNYLKDENIPIFVIKNGEIIHDQSDLDSSSNMFLLNQSSSVPLSEIYQDRSDYASSTGDRSTAQFYREMSIEAKETEIENEKFRSWFGAI